MKRVAMIVVILAAISMADLNPSITSSAPATYVGQNIVNAKIGNWFTKSNTGDIVFFTTEYSLGFLIPGTDKTVQTAFLMAAQGNANITFYVESIEANQWWPMGYFGRVNNFGAMF